MAMPTKDEVRARFWALKAAKEAADARIAPLREARDAAVNAFQVEDEGRIGGIRAIEADVLEGLSMAEVMNARSAKTRMPDQ
jgi:hypothetical protein